MGLVTSQAERDEPPRRERPVTGPLPRYAPGIPPQPYALRRRRAPDDPTLIRILGKVPTEGHLNPDDPELKPGDGYIVEETGELWVFESPPPAFVNVGSVRGPQGDPGPPLQILGELDSEGDLPAEGGLGHAYMIAGDLWVWLQESERWDNVGRIQGPEGPQGEQGIQGETGDTGPGIPAGGAALQRLAKRSEADYDGQWVNREMPPGGVTGQVLTKLSGEYVYDWRDPPATSVAWALLELPGNVALPGLPRVGSGAAAALTATTRVPLGPLTVVASQDLDLDMTGGYPRLPAGRLFMLHVAHKTNIGDARSDFYSNGEPGLGQAKLRRAARLRLVAGDMGGTRPYAGQTTKQPTLMITGTVGHMGGDLHSEVTCYHMTGRAPQPVRPWWDRPRHGPVPVLVWYRLLIVQLADLSGIAASLPVDFGHPGTQRQPQGDATRAHIRRTRVQAGAPITPATNLRLDPATIPRRIGGDYN